MPTNPSVSEAEAAVNNGLRKFRQECDRQADQLQNQERQLKEKDREIEKLKKEKKEKDDEVQKFKRENEILKRRLTAVEEVEGVSQEKSPTRDLETKIEQKDQELKQSKEENQKLREEIAALKAVEPDDIPRLPHVPCVQEISSHRVCTNHLRFKDSAKNGIVARDIATWVHELFQKVQNREICATRGFSKALEEKIETKYEDENFSVVVGYCWWSVCNSCRYLVFNAWGYTGSATSKSFPHVLVWRTPGDCVQRK